ncbi:hypothetical protein GIB67_025827 [Kingdonia uniflora]|uniref:Uncharacterized protein n=1 Tax=Kingdonia uniflora TaxID=39325 RepID=A0A7J7N4C6_9MAGN|nr:hypothetical protein GIB67_025827 [Kingdonia uniflora]
MTSPSSTLSSSINMIIPPPPPRSLPAMFHHFSLIYLVITLLYGYALFSCISCFLVVFMVLVFLLVRTETPFFYFAKTIWLYDDDDDVVVVVCFGAAEKIGLPEIPSFYGENGTIEGLMGGLNYGSSQSTIMNTGNLGFQALNQQLRQAFETLQMLQLQLGQEKAQEVIKSSVFYFSLGKDDYIEIFLRDDQSSVRKKYSSGGFAHILVNQMIRVIKDLYNANVRKIVCMGIGPLGCAPRTLWESSDQTTRPDMGHCVDEINKDILQYNTMLSEKLIDLNSELEEAEIVFCDVYQGMMEIINNPTRYGFSEVERACCGLGRYGAMVGCVAKEMACDDPSTHVWWDFYNPTEAVNSLLADQIWSGKPFNLCHPTTIREMADVQVDITPVPAPSPSDMWIPHAHI